MAAKDDDSSTMNECIGPQACFQMDTDDTVDYCITSDWHIQYPKDLRKAIKDLDHVTPLDFKAPEFDKSTNTTTPVLKPDLPIFSNDTAAIVDAMKHTYPIVEINLILLFLVYIPIGLPLLYLICRAGCHFAEFMWETLAAWGVRMRGGRRGKADRNVVVRGSGLSTESSTIVGSDRGSVSTDYARWQKWTV
ncbi:MAG: hypothetical protein Q9159_007215 [Coniocarpon cinnabarinum]